MKCSFARKAVGTILGMKLRFPMRFLSKANHFARVDKGWLEQIGSLDYNACLRNVGMSLRALSRGESLEFSSEASSSGWEKAKTIGGARRSPQSIELHTC